MIFSQKSLQGIMPKVYADSNIRMYGCHVQSTLKIFNYKTNAFYIKCIHRKSSSTFKIIYN